MDKKYIIGFILLLIAVAVWYFWDELKAKFTKNSTEVKNSATNLYASNSTTVVQPDKSKPYLFGDGGMFFSFTPDLKQRNPFK